MAFVPVDQRTMKTVDFDVFADAGLGDMPKSGAVSSLTGMFEQGGPVGHKGVTFAVPPSSPEANEGGLDFHPSISTGDAFEGDMERNRRRWNLPHVDSDRVE